MNRKILHYLIIVFIVFSYFVTFPIKDSVNATSIVYHEYFEDDLATTQLDLANSNSGFLYSAVTHATGTYISSASKRSGTYGYQKTGTSYGDTFVYFNTSGLGNKVMSNFTFYLSFQSGGGNGEILFQNKTHGTIIKLTIATLQVRYFDEVGTYHNIAYLSGWTDISFNIEDDTGICTYTVGETTVEGIVNSPTNVNNGYSIDVIKMFFGSGDVWYMDDFSFIISDSYEGGGGGGGTWEGCIDTSDYEQFQNGLDADEHTARGVYHHSEIEFTSYYPVSFTPEVFELMVLIPSDDLTDYSLYINGLYLGNPICAYPYLQTQYYLIYALQWDISSISEFNNTVLDFELVSSDVDAYDVYWTLYTSWYQDPMSNPFDVIWGSGDLDGVVPDGTGEMLSQVEGSCWRIFYSVWNPNPPPIPYENDINFILEPNGFKQDGKYDGSVYLYELQTGMIEYSVDTVDGYYSLNISWADDPVNNYGRFPINSYHDYFGFIADTIHWNGEGYYYVSLEYTSNHTSEGLVSEEFYVANLSDYPPYNPDFFVALNTDPNPSNTNSQYSVIVYINNFTRYNYWYACRFTDDTTGKLFTDKLDYFTITSVDSENYSVHDVYTRDSGGYETWILFASDDNELYLPLVEHKHNIRSIFSEAYLETNLVGNSGYVNTPFTITYYHSYYLSRVAVLWDGSVIKDYTDANQRTSFSYSSGVKGFHTLMLGLYSNGEWTPLATIKVKLNEKQGGGGTDFNLVIPQPYTYFAGIFTILLFTLSPLAIVGFMSKSTGRDFNFSSIPQFLYMVLAIIGFIVTIVIGWFPIWSVAVLVVLVVVIAVILWLRKANPSSE